MNRKTLALAVGLAGTLAIAACGGDDNNAQGAAAKPAAATAPLQIPLKPEHHSGVTGTATFVTDGPNLNVTLKLSKRMADTLPAHIHTGPCSDEPTAENPRIWANLNEVIKGTSKTTVNVVTLKELQSEPASVNVHDPEHGLRALVCADIPRG